MKNILILGSAFENILQSDEYFSKNADCYNAASSEVNDANRDAFVDGSATVSPQNGK